MPISCGKESMGLTDTRVPLTNTLSCLFHIGLRPNIHTQILQTDFHTFRLKNQLRDSVNRSKHIPLSGQLINSRNFSLVHVVIMLGEKICWSSLLGVKGC